MEVTAVCVPGYLLDLEVAFVILEAELDPFADHRFTTVWPFDDLFQPDAGDTWRSSRCPPRDGKVQFHG